MLAPGLAADGVGVYWTVAETVGGLQGCGDPSCATGLVSYVGQCEYCTYLTLDSRYVYFGGGNDLNSGIYVYTR